MGERAEIESKIRKINQEIEKLKEEKRKYEKLLQKIDGDIVPKLNKIKKEFNTAKANLKTELVSKVSTKKQKEIAECVTNINQIMTELKSIIIPKIKEKMRQIDEKIQTKSANVANLKCALATA